MYYLTVTSITDDAVVDVRMVSEEKARTIIGNLHVARLAERPDHVMIETTGGAFRYFFDRV